MARVCAEKASGSVAGPYDAPGLYGQGGMWTDGLRTQKALRKQAGRLRFRSGLRGGDE